MSDVIIARRYAPALFDIAAERQQVAQVEQELADLVALVKENQDFRRFMYDQKLTPAGKKGMLKNILGGRLSVTTLHFLFLVVDKRREKFLESMRKELRSFINQAGNILEGEVDSAVPLSPEEIAGLESALGSMVKKNVRLVNMVVPELLGGLRVRLGDRTMDSSLRQRLAALKQKLLEADISQIGVS